MQQVFRLRMDKCIPLWLFVVSISATQQRADYKGSAFHQGSVYTVTEATKEQGSSFITLSAPSLITCTHKCKRTKGCKSVIFDKDTKECQLITRLDLDIDNCASNPCQNGGNCTDGVNSYNCSCVPGYTGKHCETDIDDCASNPCQNGGNCTDGVNSYSCSCVPGYRGKHCETVLWPFGSEYGDVLQPVGDNVWFPFTSNNNSLLPSLLQTFNPAATSIEILSDGSIIMDIMRTQSRNPQEYSAPVIAGYADDFDTRNDGGSIYVRSQVQGETRDIINDDINRFLSLEGKSANFSSKFLMLVTYSNVAKWTQSNKRFNFQIAVASDDVQSYAVYNYERLDVNAQYGVGYYDPQCGYKRLVDTSSTKDLVLTSNCNKKGKHVVALNC